MPSHFGTVALQTGPFPPFAARLCLIRCCVPPLTGLPFVQSLRRLALIRSIGRGPCVVVDRCKRAGRAGAVVAGRICPRAIALATPLAPSPRDPRERALARAAFAPAPVLWCLSSRTSVQTQWLRAAYSQCQSVSRSLDRMPPCGEGGALV